MSRGGGSKKAACRGLRPADRLARWLAGWLGAGRLTLSPRLARAACCPSPPSRTRNRQAAQALQKAGSPLFTLDDMDFGRRYALEKEIRAAGASAGWLCVCFCDAVGALCPCMCGCVLALCFCLESKGSPTHRASTTQHNTTHKPGDDAAVPAPVFDESGHLLLVPCLLGIKV